MILWTVATPPVERRLTAWKLDRIPGLLPALGLFITFNLVSVAWIFFRAQSFADGWYILTHLFAGFSLTVNYSIGIGATTALVVLLSIALMELYEWLRNRGKITFALWPWWSRWACYYTLVLLILLFGALHSHAQFIYFQF
jgi:Na+-translocating ferredoxin:NAD+ oxidoreductase RnfE subunit